MSKSAWERFKDWWNKPRDNGFVPREEIRRQAREEKTANLKQEESRLSRQIEQISVAFDNLPTWGFPEHETILKTMFAELREVQEARRKSDDSL